MYFTIRSQQYYFRLQNELHFLAKISISPCTMLINVHMINCQTLQLCKWKSSFPILGHNKRWFGIYSSKCFQPAQRPHCWDHTDGWADRERTSDQKREPLYDWCGSSAAATPAAATTAPHWQESVIRVGVIWEGPEWVQHGRGHSTLTVCRTGGGKTIPS